MDKFYRKCKRCNKETEYIIQGFKKYNQRYQCKECGFIEEDWENERRGL